MSLLQRVDRWFGQPKIWVWFWGLLAIAQAIVATGSAMAGAWGLMSFNIICLAVAVAFLRWRLDQLREVKP